MDNAPTTDEQTINELTAFFGEGAGMPTAAQWRALQAGPAEAPICVINLVKLRPTADYGPGSAEPSRSGLEAFMQYGAGSTPRIVANGGAVVFGGGIQPPLVGDDEAWDLGVVVNWPNRRAMIAQFQDPAYRAIFFHRRAAVERYRASVISAAG